MSISKYLLRTYLRPGTDLGTESKGQNRQKPCPNGAYILECVVGDGRERQAVNKVSA